MSVADPEASPVVNDVASRLIAFVHHVIFPDGVDKEGFHLVLIGHLCGIDGVHEIGVMKHHACRLLWKLLSGRIDDVDKSCIGEILDIVHYRSTRGVDLLCQLADVGRLWPVDSEKIEEFLDLGEIFQFYLLDEQDVYFYHHIHRLQQILRIVPLLQIEGVVAVVEIILEVPQRLNVGQDLPVDDGLMVLENLIERVRTEMFFRFQVEKLPKGEASEL